MLQAVYQGSAIDPATAVAFHEDAFNVSVKKGAPLANIVFVLDLSGSMNWNPAGGSRIYGASSSCVADTTHCSGANCSGGFCNSSQASCSVDCSRLAIAKRALFDVFAFLLIDFQSKISFADRTSQDVH